jgi:hypothetical protein
MKESWEKLPMYGKIGAVAFVLTSLGSITGVVPKASYYVQAENLHKQDVAALIETKSKLDKKADADKLAMTQEQLDELQSWARTNQALIEQREKWEQEQQRYQQQYYPPQRQASPNYPNSPQNCEYDDYGDYWCWNGYEWDMINE